MNKLRDTDWTPILREQISNKKWELFANKVKDTLDETCPEKAIKVRNNEGPNRTPWMTEGLNQSENTLKKLMKAANKNPNVKKMGNGKTNWEVFKEYRAV